MGLPRRAGAAMPLHDPHVLLKAMIEGSAPYNADQAREAAEQVAGGRESAYDVSRAIVELGFQLSAMALAKDLRQPDDLVEMFRENARLALRALERANS